MNSASIAVEVPNSLLYVRDPALADTPDIDGVGVAWRTASCVAVSCRPDCDGATRIVIGPSDETGRERSLAFDGQLDTPSRTLIVETVADEELLRVDIPRLSTRVRIWTNGHPDTDTVVIALD